jgi:hypothetical protein
VRTNKLAEARNEREEPRTGGLHDPARCARFRALGLWLAASTAGPQLAVLEQAKKQLLSKATDASPRGSARRRRPSYPRRIDEGWLGVEPLGVALDSQGPPICPENRGLGPAWEAIPWAAEKIGKLSELSKAPGQQEAESPSVCAPSARFARSWALARSVACTARRSRSSWLRPRRVRKV